MGPPIRLGFGDQQGMEARPFSPNHQGHPDHSVAYHFFDSRPQYRQGSPHGSKPVRHQPTNRQRGGRGHHSMRGNRSANSGSTDFIRKSQVAPAVPSFGNPLPTKPPAPEVEAKKPKKKKKRRTNQLGLTPKTEEHLSSSEEEDEVDEELKLAKSVGAAGTAGQQ